MRYLLAAVVLVVLIGGLTAVKAAQIVTLVRFGQAAERAGPPPEAVGTATAGASSWQVELSAVGSVAPGRGVTISNEVPGTVTAIRFASGAVARTEQRLVELDSSVEAAQLRSAQARLQLATVNAARMRRMTARGASTRAELDTAEAELGTATAEVAAVRAQIQKKVVRAPFAGRLGIRTINVGQFLEPGTAITVLESLGPLFVDFTLPQQQLGQVAVGIAVRVSIAGDAQGKPLSGRVAAVEPAVDDDSRSIRLRATVDDPDRRLRSGMFVDLAVVLPTTVSVVTVPATAIVHAPYGDSVYVVEEARDESGAVRRGPDGRPQKVARQQFVRVGLARGDFVNVEEGVRPGQQVVSVGAFKLRNGLPVVINNDVKLDPSLAPRLENR
jgi:membrane fusion protein, multidrug efflux system